MRISDWSSDVCSSDLLRQPPPGPRRRPALATAEAATCRHLDHADLHPRAERAAEGAGPAEPSASRRLAEAGNLSPIFWLTRLIGMTSFRSARGRGLVPGIVSGVLSQAFTSRAGGKIGRASCRERVCQYV